MTPRPLVKVDPRVVIGQLYMRVVALEAYVDELERALNEASPCEPDPNVEGNEEDSWATSSA